MDEARLRQLICQAAYQLWTRGLITGDSGLVSAELHRRRFLVTPYHARRPNLTPEDVATVDMGGLNIQGGSGIPEPVWRPHRAAYKTSLGGEFDPGSSGGKRRIVTAAILADPPLLMAMARMLAGHDRLHLPDLPPLPLVDGSDDRHIADGLRESPAGVVVRNVGLLACGDSLPGSLNWIERVDAAARIELALGGHGTGTIARPTPSAASLGPTDADAEHEEAAEATK